MSYEAFEISEQDGSPVELYEFHTENFSYYYTSSESSIVVDGNTYTSEPIDRTDIELSVEQPRNAITLKVRRDHPVAELFRVTPPDSSIGLIVKRTHRGDSEVAVYWVGRVLNAMWEGTSTATLTCEPASISMNRNGLGRYYQIPCPYALYNESDCKVDRNSFATATTVTAKSGVTVTVAAKNGAHPYPGGFIEYVDGSPGITERRMIVGVSGLVFTLARPFSSALIIGSAISLFPGCDHTITTCDSVFGNKLNYGGFAYMPTKNPFKGSPVY